MSQQEHTPPRLAVRRTDPGALVVEIAGDWLDRTGLPDVSAVEKELAGGPVKALEFDATGLGRWDSALMVRILATPRPLRQRRRSSSAPQTLPAGLAKLIALSQAVPEKTDAARKELKPSFLQRVGESGLAAWTGGAAMLSFLGESVLALLKLVRGRAQFRWSDMLQVMQACGPQALGIVALINFLIGLILAFVGATELARFGASIYTADLVAVATVREMGCIMTGIILCGRTGAAFAAQLGTMKVNQEIEAFQTFGISPVRVPRPAPDAGADPDDAAALHLRRPDRHRRRLPGLDADAGRRAARSIWTERWNPSVSPAFLLGVFKGAFFGVMVALTGCLRGMQCGTNAAAVGLATTSAVVTGITWIIASDGIFAVICSALHI